MNKNTKLIIFIWVINIALIGAIVFFWVSADHRAPVIDFSASDVVYKPDMDKSLLYEGVTAADGVDGDVTNRIVIEKIVDDEAAGRVTVTYAVSDRSGNVAKASRVFSTHAKTEDSNEDS